MGGAPHGAEGAMQRVIALLLHDVYRVSSAESGFAGPAADRYKLAQAEFQAQLHGVAQGLHGVAAQGSPWVGVGEAQVALTVDDGGVSYLTLVADPLEQLGWRGHCLVTTDCIGRPGFLQRSDLRELASRGHVIGTHSVSHPARFSELSWERLVREWSDSRKVLQDLLGAEVTTGSVPGGYFSRRVAEAADAAGLKRLFTSEPTTRVARVGDCEVIGRFTVRAGCRPTFAAEIAALRPSTLMREWAAWNAKKVLKHALGEAYPRLAQRWWAAQTRSGNP
jgi:peptidoglycan/xylan/chitin deacetylase (PgdA/CDA1 family)